MNVREPRRHRPFTILSKDAGPMHDDEGRQTHTAKSFATPRRRYSLQTLLAMQKKAGR